MLPAAPTIISVLHLCLTDQNRTDAIVRAAIGLLGDLADTFPDGALRGQLASDWVDQALRVARSKTGASASSAETRKLVKWATVCALVAEPADQRRRPSRRRRSNASASFFTLNSSPVAATD